MPNRVLRQELLISDRFIEKITNNTDRMCFIALLLHADDLGNLEGTTARVHRIWRDFNVTSQEQTNKILTSLIDADLIRFYEIKNNQEIKRYIHIPRFKQRLRFLKRLNPLSPWNEEDIKNNDLTLKKTDYRRSIDGLESDYSPTIVSRREEKRREKNISKSNFVKEYEFLLMNKETYYISVDSFNDLKKTFDMLDVPQHLKLMVSWLNANPTKRKTNRGMMKFINSWLTRAVQQQKNQDNKKDQSWL